MGHQKRERSLYLAKQKATDAQWEFMDMAVKAFIRKYPVHWYRFQEQIKADRTEYQLATKEHKELRKANFRNTASFPVIEDKDGNYIDSILPTLKKIIPNLTDKNSVNYATFLKRYNCFLPGKKF